MQGSQARRLGIAQPHQIIDKVVARGIAFQHPHGQGGERGVAGPMRCGGIFRQGLQRTQITIAHRCQTAPVGFGNGITEQLLDDRFGIVAQAHQRRIGGRLAPGRQDLHGVKVQHVIGIIAHRRVGRNAGDGLDQMRRHLLAMGIGKSDGSFGKGRGELLDLRT